MEAESVSRRSWCRCFGIWFDVRLRRSLLRLPFGLPSVGARTIQKVVEQHGVLDRHAALGAFRPELTGTPRHRPFPALSGRGGRTFPLFVVVGHTGNLCPCGLPCDEEEASRGV